MRKLASVLLVALAAVCAIWAFRPEWLPWGKVITGVDALGAAQLIRSKIEEEPENRTFVFHEDKLDRRELFRALEATWPYAFSLSTTTRRNGILTVEVQVENEAQQHQASVLAAGVVQDKIQRDMPLKERLRVLHDYVVRGCIYDTETAEQENQKEGSGADAPFTAAGALLDGKAVCAGYARAFMQLCDAAGIDALYIADEDMNHGWNVVRVYGEILYIDATFDDPVPDRGDQVSTEFFLKDAISFSDTHTWDHLFYDKIVESALPAALGDAQRLYDLGLLTESPRSATIALPMKEQERNMLSAATGMAISQTESLGSACTRIWKEIEQGTLAAQLLNTGVFDEVQARQVGIPEKAVNLRNFFE